MNSKLMSYEELVERLKELETEQRRAKRHYQIKGFYPHRSGYQAYSNKIKKEINLILNAIHHAKEARKLYEYKRIYDTITKI